MNNILNKCLLSGYKFMAKLHLRQPGFTYSAFGPFTNINISIYKYKYNIYKHKHRERIQKFREARDFKYIYKNNLDKVFLMISAYSDSKDLTEKTASD